MADTLLVKIKNYKVGARGKRGFVVSLPVVWLEDMDIEPGDTIGFYRDSLDRLVLVKEGAR